MAQSMTDKDWITLAARLVDGHGVASGRASNSPYPQGTIALQTPHFLRLGLDLRDYYPGTLNLSIAPHHLQLHQPRWQGKRILMMSGSKLIILLVSNVQHRFTIG